MENKKLVPHIFLKNGKAVNDFHGNKLISDGDAVKLAKFYEENSADWILLFDLSENKWEHAGNLEVVRRICSSIDIPLICGGNIESAEDIENLLCAGCEKVFLNMSKPNNVDKLKELSEIFGKDKIAVCINEFSTIREMTDMIRESASLVLLLGDNQHLYDAVNSLPLRTMPIISVLNYDHVVALLRHENVAGVSGNAISNLDVNLPKFRQEAAARGVRVQSCECNFAWSDLKLNSDGMIPVVVQDYKNQEVLMVAYMNEEAFNNTLLTGRMTYYSRSRNELWVKGETSGHYQYVKQILIDCDNDTLLAKVAQVGAACHTGNRSCFYRNLVPQKFNDRNPLAVFEKIMDGIRGHKENPDDGSYTNRLFDEGLDRILKQIGEEALGLIFASKGENTTEIEREACDLLYHLMILMVQLDISWDDITNELYKR
ncbi:MAG: bifunctional phosphoribosyl-AMP cyclohydrolase/phosphoribosyl-ATP diphosphatase HisIE [Eubacteriales bacterium]|nr:bifunctional phosphoribosyl-AMP cyclohydrolase/phosphoribosyl-ATP diphosphatase HisIE [Eubacteriales bacterium]